MKEDSRYSVVSREAFISKGVYVYVLSSDGAENKDVDETDILVRLVEAEDSRARQRAPDAASKIQDQGRERQGCCQNPLEASTSCPVIFGPTPRYQFLCIKSPFLSHLIIFSLLSLAPETLVR
jgi:hypothetical protein